jgi:urocanate hydratase
VDEVITDLDAASMRMACAEERPKPHSIAYLGNVVDLWERLAARRVQVDLGSDQTSLHNPLGHGLLPGVGSLRGEQRTDGEDPAAFRSACRTRCAAT